MSHYPHFAELYEVNGAIYRRPPYRGLNNNNNTANELPPGGDTADLYDDDEHEEEQFAHDDGPVCGAEESIVDFGAPPGLECVKALADALPPRHPPIDPRVKEVRGPITKWTASIDVPVNLHGLLIGKAFVTKKEMEDATRCRVTIPKKGTNSTQITVDSSTGAENVSRCLARIETIVHNATKKRWTKTHFVALRIHNLGLQRNFDWFRQMVMKVDEAHVSMKNDDLFPEQAKLHMTIGMLCIQSDEDKAKARAALEEVKEKYKETKPINMEISRLGYMNDDPTQVHVLYATGVVVPGLQEFFDDVRHAFWKQGLMHPQAKEHESVKLHMTVMNTRYAATAPDDDYDATKDYANRVPFNAANLLKEHNDSYPFGWQIVDTISICEFGTTNWDDGFYETLMEEKVGKAVIERYKPKFPVAEYHWWPRKRSTLAKAPAEYRRKHEERAARAAEEDRQAEEMHKRMAEERLKKQAEREKMRQEETSSDEEEE